MNNKISQEIREHLDEVAETVAVIFNIEDHREKIGEPPNEERKALLVLGSAYLYLYNLLLEEDTEFD